MPFIQQTLIPGCDRISRPALRYFGGKFQLAPWIISHFPKHWSYVEPFGGAFSVGLQKLPTGGREIYNDLNSGACNFFKVLQSRADELIAAILNTPRTVEEFNTCRQFHIDELEQARRFYVLADLGFNGGGGRWCGGFSESRGEAAWEIEHLWPICDRIQDVVIQYGDALDCIRCWDGSGVLFYVDPPYAHQVRRSKDRRHKQGAPRRQYACEMNDQQHQALAEVLHQVRGKVVLSGYPSPLYDQLFSGWRTVETCDRNSHREPVIEKLWMNF